MTSRHDEWEAAHRFDDEQHLAHEEESREQHEAEREPELVHGRPIYLGSGVSEFPCGLSGRLALHVSDEVEDITCAKCRAEEKVRIARLSRPLRDEAGDALAAGLGYTHAQSDNRNHLGFTTPCGIYVGREQYDGPTPRVVSTRPGDRINCPGCLAVLGALP